MSEKFRLDRKIGFRNTFYTKCTNVIIDSIGPSIILRSIYKFTYMDLLKSVYINGPGYNKRYLMVVLLGCPCKVPSLRINS